MKKIICTTIFMFSFVLLDAEDIVVTKDGNIIRGKILKYSEEELVIKIDGNNTLTFKKDNIKTVDFDNSSNSSSESSIIEGFGVFGITYGLPGGLNLTGGYYSKGFGTRFNMGIIIPEYFGIQALFEVPIYVNKNVFFSPAFAIGHISITSFGSGTYTGLGLDTHIYGFTTFLGISLPIISNGSVFLFDIGYKYAWN